MPSPQGQERCSSNRNLNFNFLRMVLRPVMIKVK